MRSSNYLIACEGLDQATKNLLWKARERRGNFETVLGDLPTAARKAMLAELFGMFNEMNAAFTRTKFEPRDGDANVRNFLVQFDAIFTPQPRPLLETHYLNDNIILSGDPRWKNGWCMPGTKIRVSPNYDQIPWRQLVADPSTLKNEPLTQPYFHAARVKQMVRPPMVVRCSSWAATKAGPDRPRANAEMAARSFC